MRRFFSGSVVARWGAAFLTPHIVTSIGALPRYLAEWVAYQKAAPRQRLAFRDSYPCLADRVRTTPFDPHYFFQAAWLARRLQESRPSFHVDVGSSAMMINVLSAGMHTAFVDYRPLHVRLSNLSSLAGDIVRLPFRDACIASLSCLHVIEHVGLGRYGDPINPAGSQLAADELQRVLQPGGRLFLSVPVGRERVCFNAHRVFAPGTVQSLLRGLRLGSFCLVDVAGRFHEHVLTDAGTELEYGCGLFEFVKARA
jgi:SAM-dependent methyltransferase